MKEWGKYENIAKMGPFHRSCANEESSQAASLLSHANENLRKAQVRVSNAQRLNQAAYHSDEVKDSIQKLQSSANAYERNIKGYRYVPSSNNNAAATDEEIIRVAEELIGPNRCSVCNKRGHNRVTCKMIAKTRRTTDLRGSKYYQYVRGRSKITGEKLYREIIKTPEYKNARVISVE